MVEHSYATLVNSYGNIRSVNVVLINTVFSGKVIPMLTGYWHYDYYYFKSHVVLR
jgi:hypothetical protein